MKDKINSMATILLLALCLTLPVAARATSANPSWQELAPETQKLLRPFSDRWDNFSPERKERLVKGAGRWAAMAKTRS